MSDAKSPIASGADFTRSYLGRMNRIVEQAARADERGDWGIDGWVTLVHNLIDLQIKASATAIQMAAAGPWWLTPVQREAPLSAPISVPPADHPRAIFIAESFERVGHQGVKIPDAELRFVPPVVAAGETTFQIDLSNDNYAGANYKGKIALRRTGGSTSPGAMTIPVVVGL